MSIQPERRLSLQITQASMPIRGRLCDECGRAWTFSSWLGLLAALHAAIPNADTHQTGDPRSASSTADTASDADLLTTREDG